MFRGPGPFTLRTQAFRLHLASAPPAYGETIDPSVFIKLDA